jgi:asparagine synthase (glutamine-hydrolysing)
MAIGRALRAIAVPGMPPKLPGLFTHSTSLTTAYFLRRSLYLADELNALLDESWINEGLERLATASSLAATVAPLRAAPAPEYAQIAALESCWYMRNQLLRDTDWSSMAHGVEVRVPFVDYALIERLGPAIGSKSPPSKRDLAACSDRIPATIRDRAKTGFTTPVRKWIAKRESERTRGLRGWATLVHRRFRVDMVIPDSEIPPRVDVGQITSGAGGCDCGSAIAAAPAIEHRAREARIESLDVQCRDGRGAVN